MNTHSLMSLEDRLRNIVNQACDVLCQQIAHGKICVNNEASFQLHLATLMRQIGSLYELESSSFFSIELEKLFTNVTTCKSNGNSRCDIFIQLTAKGVSNCASIELKYFKKDPNAAVTDEKFSVLMDIENVEQYKAQTKGLGYVIVLTDNGNHATNPTTKALKYDICDGQQIGGNYPNTKDRSLTIGCHTCNWDEYPNNNWLLKVEV